MAMATITARVDAEDKKRFDQFCADVGLTTSAAVNIYVKAVLREHKIPFDIEEPNDVTKAALAEYAQMKAHPEQYKSYDSVDALFDDIFADEAVNA